MTSVDTGKNFPPLAHTNKLLVLGSCFSTNIGEKLLTSGFCVDLNPFGVLYNPMSIAEALKEIQRGKVYSSTDLFAYDGLWHSQMHHGSFSAVTEQETLEHINSRLSKVHAEWPDVDRLLLAFGTSFIYSDKEKEEIVSNCHKQPDVRFIRRRLSVDEIIDTYVPLFQNWLQMKPELKIIFTVSPIRHLRDGLHENQLSKAILLMAVDKLLKQFPENVFYFPAYEIVLDELRDYRFYTDDLLHPSTLAIDYIWERFTSCCFSEKTQALATECENLHKSLSHRVLHPDQKSNKEFLGQIVLKINRLKEKYPYLDLKFQ